MSVIVITPTRGAHTVIEAVEERAPDGRTSIRILSAYRIGAKPGSVDLTSALETKLLDCRSPFGTGSKVRIIVECSDYSGGHGLAKDLYSWACAKASIRARAAILFFQMDGRDLPGITRDGWRRRFPRRLLAVLLVWVASERMVILSQGIALAKELRTQLDSFRERQVRDADTAEDEDLALGLGFLAWSLSVGQPNTDYLPGGYL